MSQKKVINPIDIREVIEIRYARKAVRGAGIFVLSKHINSYIRDYSTIETKLKTQGFRLCLKRK